MRSSTQRETVELYGDRGGWPPRQGGACESGLRVGWPPRARGDGAVLGVAAGDLHAPEGDGAVLGVRTGDLHAPGGDGAACGFWRVTSTAGWSG